MPKEFRIVFLLFSVCFVRSPLGVYAEDSSLLARLEPIEAYGETPNRNLEQWKKEISAYSLRHYGVATFAIDPSVIVLHYTASDDFPLNLISSASFKDEAPGVASHFVIDEKDGAGVVYQILPLDVMSRATFGANFCSISIEMVARDEATLLSKRALLETAIKLVRELMERYGIPVERVYSHEEIDAFLAEDPHGAFFDNTIEGMFLPRKIDPGKRVMSYIRERLGAKSIEQ
jgi:N-acetyl-anhydromuramyl-L-alanine amidase AmpD